jgi:hypothetical protein
MASEIITTRLADLGAEEAADLIADVRLTAGRTRSPEV